MNGMTHPAHHILATMMLFLVAIWTTSAHAESRTDPHMPVVELFTSQGCSSCPPADKLLHELSQRGDVLALTYPVDYWDYLGWKDTLASPVNTERQRAYAQFFNLRSIYTPQMIIDGTVQIVGSRRTDVLDAIGERRGAHYPAKIALERDGNVLSVSIEGDNEKRDSTVWLLQIDNQRTVPIQRGENGGKTITYHNVVRQISPIGMWSGQQAEFRLPLGDITSAGRDGCAVLIQDSTTGQIIGSARYEVDEAG